MNSLYSCSTYMNTLSVLQTVADRPVAVSGISVTRYQFSPAVSIEFLYFTVNVFHGKDFV